MQVKQQLGKKNRRFKKNVQGGPASSLHGIIINSVAKSGIRTSGGAIPTCIHSLMLKKSLDLPDLDPKRINVRSIRRGIKDAKSQ